MATPPFSRLHDQPRKPHVVFVRGPIIFKNGSINNEATPAIAFAYLSAYLRKFGYKTSWVDAIGEGLNRIWPLTQYPGFGGHGLDFDQIAARIPEDADVIAFSSMFSGEWPALRDLILELRDRFPGPLFIAGGEHVTALPEYSLRDCPALDLCVRGEGEHTLYELLESYSKRGSFESVAGISFLDDNGLYRQNGDLPRVKDPSQIPWPYWPEGYLERFWRAGKSFGVSSERDMPFLATRGCPYRCTFCSSPAMWTTRYVLRDPKDCVAEIKSYIERYDITSLQFYDLTAITKKSWVVEFCEELIANGIKLEWSLPSGTRSEALDAETLALIKKAGCRYLVYAPESGSRETLTAVKKQIKLPHLEQSLLEARRQGVIVRTNLIIGFPSETRKNVFQTIFWGLKMLLKGLDECALFIFSPYPGSELFHQLKAAGKIELGDDYFLDLTSANSHFFSSHKHSYNAALSPRELALYRTGALLLGYALSYLYSPMRLLRTIRNLNSKRSVTVLEHRIKDALKRKRPPAQDPLS